MSDNDGDLGMSINVDEIDRTNEYEVLPPGVYTVIICEASVKPSKNKPQNKFAALTHEIVDGEFKGRKFFNNVNFINENPKTEAWAKKTLAQISDAVNFAGQLRNVNVFKNIPFKVLLESSLDDKNRPQNTVKKYINLKDVEGIAAAQGASTPSAGSAQPTGGQAAVAHSTTVPWAK